MPTKVGTVTNPSPDDATRYLNSWSDVVISSARSQSAELDVYELKGDKVTKENLTRLIKEKNPHLILFHGHGGSKIILGFEANILIACDDNESILSNRIIHSLSCDSGQVLGPRCVSIGSKAFVGYKKEFKFAHQGEKTDTLRYSDVLAGFFLRPAFEVDKALLEGNSIEQTHQRSQKMYRENLQMLLTSSDPTLNKTYASGLYHDMINQVALGDKNSSF